MKNTNTVIFDMDGVIVDSMPYHIKSWKEALSTIEMSVSDLEIYLMEGMTGRETIDKLVSKSNRSLSDETVEKVLKLKRKIFNDIFTVKLMKGIRDFLLELNSRKYHLALVTGTRLEVVKKVLQMGLDNVFKVIVTGEMVNNGKPSPEPYLKAVHELDVKREDCLVIENAPAGIASAKNAGLTCFAVETSLPGEYLKGADRIFPSIDDLSKFLINSA
ncbi:MAG: beta-phosphoglucomutase [Candidatus Scalindua rubra]|uniref:Beta-phosphoglucomutase n=1 Tax=Candidatus Scalindua rubra TaxID=1872076 RepID=A0A1E3X412_9BACT|nr:MAG: beta-phosphoglucomutase [Candidatus Scalindua rubra]